MVCLFEALKGKENIETLNLQDNFLVDTGVDGLCDFLVAAKNLKSLNLGDCNIKLAANGKIVEALEVDPSTIIFRKASLCSRSFSSTITSSKTLSWPSD